jgi:hypothetical protein
MELSRSAMVEGVSTEEIEGGMEGKVSKRSG